MTSTNSSERRARHARGWTKAAAPLLVLLTAAACGGHEAAKPAERESVSAPTTVVQSTTIHATRAIAGTVRSANVSPLAARVIGNVVRVHVAEGDRVRKGQVLIEIDPREARAQTGAASSGIAAAEAHANLAETTFRRYAALRERNSVSQQELDDVRARRDAAQAELSRARAMAAQAATFLDYSIIRAPMDGVVTARFVDPGAQAAPGMPLLTIEDATTFRVEATVPEELSVRPGDRVIVEAASPIEATVTRVQPNVDAITRASLVQIGIREALRPGSYVRVRFRTGERAALTVPPSAIVRRGQLTSVFVVDPEGVARMRLITVGDDGEILSGVDAGERIVTDASRVRDGVRVS